VGGPERVRLESSPALEALTERAVRVASACLDKAIPELGAMSREPDYSRADFSVLRMWLASPEYVALLPEERERLCFEVQVRAFMPLTWSRIADYLRPELHDALRGGEAVLQAFREGRDLELWDGDDLYEPSPAGPGQVEAVKREQEQSDLLSLRVQELLQGEGNPSVLVKTLEWTKKLNDPARRMMIADLVRDYFEEDVPSVVDRYLSSVRDGGRMSDHYLAFVDESPDRVESIVWAQKARADELLLQVEDLLQGEVAIGSLVKVLEEATSLKDPATRMLMEERVRQRFGDELTDELERHLLALRDGGAAQGVLSRFKSMSSRDLPPASWADLASDTARAYSLAAPQFQGSLLEVGRGYRNGSNATATTGRR
jgi:hypothetical protein